MTTRIVEMTRDVIGTYSPLVDSNGNVINGMAGINYEYLVVSAVLLLFILSIFRLIGGIVCHR